MSKILPILLPLALLSMASIDAQPTIAASDQLPGPMACQAVIPLPGGDSLIYQIMGNFVGAETTTMTVHRRKGNDRPQILLRPAYANDYETIAPDADYSKLPFTGTFRGQPNDGRRLYSVRGSVHGLYVSLRPTTGVPQRMQVVHYLSSGKFIRSGNGTGTCWRK